MGAAAGGGGGRARQVSGDGPVNGTPASLPEPVRARVVALPPDEFNAWQERQTADIQQSQALLSLQRKVRGEN